MPQFPKIATAAINCQYLVVRDTAGIDVDARFALGCGFVEHLARERVLSGPSDVIFHHEDDVGLYQSVKQPISYKLLYASQPCF